MATRQALGDIGPRAILLTTQGVVRKSHNQITTETTGFLFVLDASEFIVSSGSSFLGSGRRVPHRDVSQGIQTPALLSGQLWTRHLL